eukprot:4388290-Amphidinium_carterae.3
MGVSIHVKVGSRRCGGVVVDVPMNKWKARREDKCMNTRHGTAAQARQDWCQAKRKPGLQSTLDAQHAQQHKQDKAGKSRVDAIIARKAVKTTMAKEGKQVETKMGSRMTNDATGCINAIRRQTPQNEQTVGPRGPQVTRVDVDNGWHSGEVVEVPFLVKRRGTHLFRWTRKVKGCARSKNTRTIKQPKWHTCSCCKVEQAATTQAEGRRHRTNKQWGPEALKSQGMMQVDKESEWMRTSSCCNVEVKVKVKVDWLWLPQVKLCGAERLRFLCEAKMWHGRVEATTRAQQERPGWRRKAKCTIPSVASAHNDQIAIGEATETNYTRTKRSQERKGSQAVYPAEPEGNERVFSTEKREERTSDKS